MKPFIYLILLLSLVACSAAVENPVAPKPDIADDYDKNKINNHSAEETDLNADTLINYITPVNGTLKAQIDHFTTSIAPQYKQIEETKPHLLDRFENEQKIKITLQKKFEVPYGKSVMVYPVANISAYEFSTDESFENVLENWFNCFESDCDQVVPGTEGGPLKTTPAFALIIPKKRQIIYLQYACEHEGNDWKRFKTWIKEAFPEKESYGFELSCGSKIKWFGKFN